MNKHYPPEFEKEEFNCIHCGVFARQNWQHIRTASLWIGYSICTCVHCNKTSLWKNDTKTILDPMATIYMPSHEEMPESIKSLL